MPPPSNEIFTPTLPELSTPPNSVILTESSTLSAPLDVDGLNQKLNEHLDKTVPIKESNSLKVELTKSKRRRDSLEADPLPIAKRREGQLGRRVSYWTLGWVQAKIGIFWRSIV